MNLPDQTRFDKIYNSLGCRTTGDWVNLLARLISVVFIGALFLETAGADCTEHAEPLFRASALRPGGGQSPDSTDKWGYGYDSLLLDLEKWRRNPLVKVDSIGATVEGRAIWMLTITEGRDSVGKAGDPSWRKRRVFVHARTHPAEVQAHHISKEMIRFLLDSTAASAAIRGGHIFNIIPMYNPDGVELGHPRQNANRVDIESNWNKPILEPEVQALKRQFEFLMAGSVPVEVALNLHSDQFNCKRFFFFHEAGGTSPAFVDLEKDFIGKVRRYFPAGIEEWSFITSWPLSTGTQYPEGFWWLGFKEKVMALTYEDANCPGSGEYDSTARALVQGAVDYLGPRVASLMRWTRTETYLLRESGGFRLLDAVGHGSTRWSLIDATGRLLGGGPISQGSAFIPTRRMLPGAALVVLSGGARATALRLFIPSLSP